MNERYKSKCEELKLAKDTIESREALICATKMALEHVIENARLEITQGGANSYTVETLENIKA